MLEKIEYGAADQEGCTFVVSDPLKIDRETAQCLLPGEPDTAF